VPSNDADTEAAPVPQVGARFDDPACHRVCGTISLTVVGRLRHRWFRVM
jgi:hypothetical protein